MTVNTDNLTVSDTTLEKEYEMLVKHHDFTPKELRRLVLNGVDAAFLPDAEKRTLRTVIVQEFNTLGIASD